MSLLHYVTYKYVVIKDKRLGIGYYCLAGLIICYTMGQLLLKKAYLEFDTSPHGNIRLLVNSPVIHKSDGKIQINQPYCCQRNNRSVQSETKACHSCRVLDALSLNWPVESHAITLATFIKERWEQQVRQDQEVDKFTIIQELSYYSWNPEHVVLKIEHSMSAFGSKLSASHRVMDGILTDHNGNMVRRLSNGGVSKANKISLQELLDAGGMKSLDTTSDALNSNGRSYRENGLVLRVAIDYQNADTSWFGTSKLTYAYTVEHVAYSDQRVKQEIPILVWPPTDVQNSTERRVVKKRYGVRLEFYQRGKLGRFSASNLIVQVVSALGLITLTATVVDVLALYVVPSKDVYRKYVFDHSPELRRTMKELVDKKTE